MRLLVRENFQVLGKATGAAGALALCAWWHLVSWLGGQGAEVVACVAPAPAGSAGD